MDKAYESTMLLTLVILGCIAVIILIKGFKL